MKKRGGEIPRIRAMGEIEWNDREEGRQLGWSEGTVVQGWVQVFIFTKVHILEGDSLCNIPS